jgi:hypothetical protein
MNFIKHIISLVKLEFAYRKKLKKKQNEDPYIYK